MAKTGWERYSETNDDGYYVEPLTLQVVDSGGAVAIALSRQKKDIIAYLTRQASVLNAGDLSGEATLVQNLADAIKRGDHYASSSKSSADNDG